MPDINPSIPVVGQPDSTEEPKIVTALTQLIAAVNDIDSDNILDGTITGADLAANVAAALGLDSGSTNRRAMVHNATAEAASSLTLASLPTPDKISGLVIPSSSLLLVSYFARVTSASTSASTNFQMGLTLDTNLTAINTVDPTGRSSQSQNGAIWTAPGAGTYSGSVWTTGGTPRQNSQFTNQRHWDGWMSAGTLDSLTTNQGFFLPGWSALIIDAGTYDLEAMWWQRSGSSSVMVQDRFLSAMVVGGL